VEGKYTGCWKPESITRAMTDMSNKRLGTDASRDVSVIDCESGETVTRSIGEFFKGFDSRAYRESKLQQHGLLKLKDWPSEDDFRQKMPRHFTDFVQMLPFQEYTNQVDGPLNLSTKLPKEWVPPDLGPKSYVAMGRVKEHGVGDSVTRLHQDMSDAVNVLVHVGPSQADEDDDGDRGETASHTTPFAWCTPFLKDFPRRHSSPALPFQRLTGKTFD
jgi:lysine-specific demethylase 3